jgi:hypothetical protein
VTVKKHINLVCGMLFLAFGCFAAIQLCFAKEEMTRLHLEISMFGWLILGNVTMNRNA